MKPTFSYSFLTTPIDQTQKKRASDQLEEKLVRMIISLELPPGTVISEIDLIKRLNCGRTPLREALQRLAQEYLIVPVPRHGIIIAELNLINYAQLIDAVALHESYSVYLAVNRSTDAELSGLSNIINAASEAFNDGDLLSVAELDLAFHRSIAELTRNVYLVDTTIRLHRMVSRYYFIALKNGLDAEISLAEHRKIIKAFRRRDSEEARNLAYLHMMDAKDRIASTLLSGPKPIFSGQPLGTLSISNQVNSTIRIGVPTMMTGPGAPMGADIIAGICMAVKSVNANGGVLGKNLEIVFADTKHTTAEDCASAAQALNEAGVVAYFPGAFFSSAGSIEFGRYPQPLLHASSMKETVDPVAANLNELDNVFQVSASEESLGPNAFLNMISLPYQYPNKKVALLGGDISYDMLIQQGIASLAQKEGWEIVLNDTFSFGKLDFGSELARIRAEDPAVIFACITSTDSAVSFVNQFLQDPTNALIFLRWSPVASEFIQLLGSKANGILWQTEYAYLPTAENISWAKEFKAEFGREPGVAWPALMDDMLHIWIKAVESVGDPKDYRGIIEYLRNLSQHPYQGRAGRYGINPERNEGLTGAEWLPIHFYQIQDQKNILLFLGTKPFEGSDAVPAGKFQIPPWINRRRRGRVKKGKM